jgi:predicted double-glycine peptidase
MKKKMVLVSIIGVLAVSGLILASCDNGNTSDDNNNTGKTTGSITIKNNSNNFSITYVDVYDIDTNETIFYDDDTEIARGKTATFNNIDPGNKLKLYIENNAGDFYESTQFVLRAGETKNFTYDGLSLR